MMLLNKVNSKQTLLIVQKSLVLSAYFVTFCCTLFISGESFGAGSCSNEIGGQKISEPQWVANKSPGKALWENTVKARKALNNKIDQGTPLYLLEGFSDFKSLPEEKPGWFQFVSENAIVFKSEKDGRELSVLIEPSTRRDEELLQSSQLESHPVEVYRFSVRSGKEEVYGEIKGGGHDPSIDNSRQVIPEKTEIALEGLASQIKKPISEIIFSHTHPLAQFVILEPGEAPSQILASLSKSDLAMAQRNSLDYPDINFTIKAITPAGVNYSITFRNGEALLP